MSVLLVRVDGKVMLICIFHLREPSMYLNRTQNSAFVLVILTLFTAPAWGQTDLPSNPSPAKVDSLFGNQTESLVDYNGYFKPARHGLWADPATTTGPVESTDVATEPNVEPTQVFDQPSVMKLRIGFEALLWERGRAENTVFATEDNGNQWSFSDFDLTKGDARYIIQYMGDDDTGYELTFFDFNSFASTIDADGQNVRPFFFQALPATIGNSFDLVYESRLKSVEINSWVRQSATKRTAFGVRHLNLDEVYNTQTSPTSGLFSRTDNDLWGLTKSWERRRPILNRLNLVGGLNVGLYLNRANIDVDTLNVDDNSSAKNLAGNLGFNVGIRYRVSNNVSFRFGYEGLALFGVALASTQSLNQQILNGLEDPELGSIYFGGLNIGAVASF